MTDPATAMYRARADAHATVAGDSDAPEVLCAHGSLMDRTMFAPQLDALADDYRIAAYDLRARTERFGAPYDLDDLADDAVAVADGLEMDEPVLVGMSMGGFTALRALLAHPDRFAGVVLVDSIAAPHPETDRETYRGMIEDVRDADRVPRTLAETVTHFLFGETTREERPDLVEHWVDRWTTYSGEAVYREIDSWLDRADVTEAAGDLDHPALVVHGEEDASIDLERAEHTAEALDARFEPIPEAGHSSNLEQPDAVNRVLREFLASVDD